MSCNVPPVVPLAVTESQLVTTRISPAVASSQPTVPAPVKGDDQTGAFLPAGVESADQATERLGLAERVRISPGYLPAQRIPARRKVVRASGQQTAAAPAAALAVSGPLSFHTITPQRYLDPRFGGGGPFPPQGNIGEFFIFDFGSPDRSEHLVYMRADSPYKTIQDVRAASTPPKCGATGTGTA